MSDKLSGPLRFGRAIRKREADELPRGSVLRMNLDGSERETFAFGLRNPRGLSLPFTEEANGRVFRVGYAR